MSSILDVADYIVKKYKEYSNETLDEMKLHKLLYFTQRETLALTGHPAFPEEFEGWKYGPTSPKVRHTYVDGEIFAPVKNVPDELKYIVNNVILEYGAIASWKLSELSHREISWLNSRKGLASNEPGNRKLQLSDIMEDAKKIRPYDHVWDMYYDEFDDYDENEGDVP